MQQLKVWFEALEQNEQKIVLIATAFFAFVILVFGILKPLSNSVSSLQNQVDSRQQSVEKWKQAMPQLLANKGQSSNSNSTQAISSVVTTTTKQFNLRVSRVQEKGTEEMQVWFDNVPFSDFVRWVAEVQDRYKLKVASVNIRNKDRNGLASIDIKLLRG